MKRATLLACVFFVCAPGLGGTVFAQDQQTAPPHSRYINGVPFFMVIPRGDSQRALAEAFASANIPMWSGSFTFQATTYTFVMIGTDPAAGSATTNVSVVIIPLKFNFARGVSLSAEYRL